MESSFFSKFNLYDQLGYLFVGSIFLVLFILDFKLLGIINLIPAISASNFIVYLILAYFLGHTVQAISNLVIKEKKENFNSDEKEILGKVRDYFKIKSESLSNLYSVCYMYSTAHDITGQVSLFNALYSLYRGWFIVFILESIFLAIFFITTWFTLWNLIFLIISCLFCFIFYRRMLRFYKYSRNKTFQTFTILLKLKSK